MSALGTRLPPGRLRPLSQAAPSGPGPSAEKPTRAAVGMDCPSAAGRGEPGLWLRRRLNRPARCRRGLGHSSTIAVSAGAGRTLPASLSRATRRPGSELPGPADLSARAAAGVAASAWRTRRQAKRVAHRVPRCRRRPCRHRGSDIPTARPPRAPSLSRSHGGGAPVLRLNGLARRGCRETQQAPPSQPPAPAAAPAAAPFERHAPEAAAAQPAAKSRPSQAPRSRLPRRAAVTPASIPVPCCDPSVVELCMIISYLFMVYLFMVRRAAVMPASPRQRCSSAWRRPVDEALLRTAALEPT